MEKIVDNKSIWKNTLNNAQIPDSLLSYFDSMTESSKLYKIDIENKKAYVKCDNIFEKEFLSNNCYSLLEESLNKTTNVDFSILFFTKDEQALVDNETSPILISTSISDGVNAKYTFADYVVSSKNKMLVQAAQSIVLRPNAGPYNPLFIHGGSGLGKTHLLHAIGNEIKVKMPHKKVKYISSEEFGDAVVNAMLKKEETTIQEKINQLKKNYQNYDILLLDDIQYISSRDKTKEIFFAILNNYIDDEKQIVITSDSSPEELSEFEDRFITRFKKGLTLSVSPPDVDTAKKIIQLKLKKIHMVEEEMLDDDVLEFIALNFSESVRELEGVINKLMFWSINNDVDKIIMDIAINVLGEIKPSKKITIDKIKRTVAKKYGITLEALESTSRKKDIIIARHLSIYLTKELLNLPLQKIGKEFGRKDHTTIMNAISKIEAKRKIEPLLNNQIRSLLLEFKKG